MYLSKEDEDRITREIETMRLVEDLIDKVCSLKETLDRKEKGVSPITMDLVIKGLKFIAEHPEMEQEKLVDGLLALGCNFTFSDIDEQFPEKEPIREGVKKGTLRSGALLIANAKSVQSRKYVNELYLNHDDENYGSIYSYIRKVTGDETYTRDRISALTHDEEDGYIYSYIGLITGEKEYLRGETSKKL